MSLRKVHSSAAFCLPIVLTVLAMLSCRAAMYAQRWHASNKTQLLPQSAAPLEDMAHTSWVRRDGAPSDIAALAQTTDGYLWVGSRLGLFRFDGFQFSSYPFSSVDPRLPSSDIAALAADRDGGLWIGYRMGGISYLQGNKEVDYDQRSGLVSESTEQLLCRGDGSVWATADGRLMHFTGSSWENYSAKHGLMSEGLYSLFFDRDGDLWTAEKGHVFELKRGEDKFVTLDIPNQAVNQFGQTSDGTIWISDAWKNVRPLFDNQGSRAVRIAGVPLLLVDRAGRLWLAHDFGGLTRVRLSENEQQVESYTFANGLTDGQTRAIIEDRQGAIWVGTTRGIDRFQDSPIAPFHSVRIDYHPALIADTKSGIWIDDMDKPLMRLENGNLSFVGKAHGSSSLYQEASGAIWLHDPITHSFYRFADDETAPTSIPVPDVAKEVENWCLGQDPSGAFLACFEGHGLWRYSDHWERVTAPGLPQESPQSLQRGENGRLWIGFPHNHIALEDANGFHIYGPEQGVELNAIITFYDADGLVLAGGSDGLAQFDGQGFRGLHLRTASLLRGISGIARDRTGDLWLNAGSGLIRIPASELTAALQNPTHAMDFRLLNERDGLVGAPAQGKPAPSLVVDTSGSLWVATSGQLVSINPAAVRREMPAPNVLLQGVRVNGSPLRYDGETPLSVSSRQLKSLEFDYIGVDLNSPERVVYQYMLEGQDKEWQEAGDRRHANYTNLKPGHYRFRVRAASGTGQWREMQAAVPFHVTPAFYQTYLFLFFCIAVGVCLIWMVYRWRVYRIAVRLDSQFEARLSERTRIAQELHDTLLQGVLSISMQLNIANDQLPSDSKVKPILERVVDLMGNVINDGRNAVRGLRTLGGGTLDLAEAFSRIPHEIAVDDASIFRVSVEGSSQHLFPLVRDEVYKICKEAITNAFRHSKAQRIEVLLAYRAEEFRVAVRDNGCGVDPQVLRRGREGHWGLQGIRERAAKVGAKAGITSSPAGTEVALRIPGRIAYEEDLSVIRPFTWLAKLRSRRANSSDIEGERRAV